MLGTMLTAHGMKMVAEPLAGATPDPIDLSKNLLTALPLGMGLSLPVAMSSTLASQQAMELLAGSLPQPQQALVAGAVIAGGGLFPGLVSRSLFGLAVTAAVQLAGGALPDAASLGKDVFIRSPWLLATLVNPALMPLADTTDMGTQPSTALFSSPVQLPVMPTLPYWIVPHILPTIIGSPFLAPWSNSGDALLAGLPFPSDTDFSVMDEPRNWGDEIKSDGALLGAEVGAILPAKPAADTVMRPEIQRENPVLPESGPDASLSPEAVEYFALQCNPYMEQVLDKLVPPVTEQLERRDPFIITDMSPPTITETYDAQGKPVLRHIFEQQGIDANILQQDHWQTLIDRLWGGQTISWDHIALVMLSTLGRLSADTLVGILSKVPLFSSVLHTRTVTVDVSLHTYTTEQDLPQETIAQHDTLTINQPGKDLVTDRVQQTTQAIKQKTVTSVTTYDVTLSPVSLTGTAISADETERKTFSYAEQEHFVTVTIDNQDSLTATLQEGNSATASRPQLRTTQQYTQWSTFAMDGDLRPLAQLGPILDAHLEQAPEIQVIAFSQDTTEHSEVAASHALVGEKNIPETLLADVLEGRGALTDKLADLAQSLDTGAALSAPDHMYGSSSDSLSDTITHEPVTTVQSEGLIFDGTTTTVLAETTTNTRQTDVYATQIAHESYTLHTGKNGTTELSRSDKTIKAIIKMRDTNLTTVDEKSEITISKYGKLDKLVGNASNEHHSTTTSGSQTETTYLTDHDITAALQDGVLTPDELMTLGAKQVEMTSTCINKQTTTGASAAGRTFNEGFLSDTPVVGSLVDLASKSSYGFEITAVDYIMVAADVASFLPPLRIGAGVAKVAVKLGARAGGRVLARQAPQISSTVGEGISQAQVALGTMTSQGLNIYWQLLKFAEKTDLSKQLGKASGKIVKTSRELNTACKKYQDKALEYARDTYHKLNNFELTPKEFLQGIFKDMSVNNPAWKELVIKKKLANRVIKKNGATYTTDKHGRPTGVFSKKLTLKPAVRDTNAQSSVNKMGKTGDDAGHLLANRFGGEPGPLNLVPQNATLNRGAWKRMENTWERSLKEGKSVENVSIRPCYSGDSVRPYKFEVRYRIGGQNYTQTFYNTKG